MRVVLDGRVDGADGIGRYTRSVVARLCDPNPADLDVTVLRPGTVRRYSRPKETGRCSAPLTAAQILCTHSTTACPSRVLAMVFLVIHAVGKIGHITVSDRRCCLAGPATRFECVA